MYSIRKRQQFMQINILFKKNPAEDKGNGFIQYLQNASPNPVGCHILNLYEFSVACSPRVHQIRHHLLSEFHHWPDKPAKTKTKRFKI